MPKCIPETELRNYLTVKELLKRPMKEDGGVHQERLDKIDKILNRSGGGW